MSSKITEIKVHVGAVTNRKDTPANNSTVSQKSSEVYEYLAARDTCTDRLLDKGSRSRHRIGLDSGCTENLGDGKVGHYIITQTCE